MRVPGDICALGFLNRNKKKVRDLSVIEFFDGFHKPEVAFLNKVKEVFLSRI